MNIITVESIERQKDSIQSVTIGSSSDTSFNNLILLIYSKKQYADDNVIAEPKYAKIIRALPAETKIIDRDNLSNINKAVGNNIIRISENMSVKISAVDTLGNVSVEIVNAKNTDKTNIQVGAKYSNEQMNRKVAFVSRVVNQGNVLKREIYAKKHSARIRVSIKNEGYVKIFRKK